MWLTDDKKKEFRLSYEYHPSRKCHVRSMGQLEACTVPTATVLVNTTQARHVTGCRDGIYTTGRGEGDNRLGR